METALEGTSPQVGSTDSAPCDERRRNFRNLRRELRRQGLFRKDPVGVLSLLALHSTLFVAGLTLFLIDERIAVKVAATVIWGYGLTGIASNTHSSSHYATSERRWLNRLLTYVGYPVVTGFSATYWWHKHIVLHHSHPNLVGHDVDIDWMPLFAITTEDRRGASRWRSMIFRCQVVLVPLSISLNMTYGQFHSLRFLWQNMRSCNRRKFSHWLDTGCLLLHAVLWIGLPMMILPWPSVLAFYLLRNTVLGYTFFLLNAPSHYPVEASCLSSPETTDFVRRQTMTTLNYRVGPIGRALCSGVEYQIEHHLFPAICHTRLPGASRLVREYCKKHGYPYRELSWSEALVKAVWAFHEPKKVEEPCAINPVKLGTIHREGG